MAGAQAACAAGRRSRDRGARGGEVTHVLRSAAAPVQTRGSPPEPPQWSEERPVPRPAGAATMRRHSRPVPPAVPTPLCAAASAAAGAAGSGEKSCERQEETRAVDAAQGRGARGERASTLRAGAGGTPPSKQRGTHVCQAGSAAPCNEGPAAPPARPPAPRHAAQRLWPRRTAHGDPCASSLAARMAIEPPPPRRAGPQQAVRTRHHVARHPLTSRGGPRGAAGRRRLRLLLVFAAHEVDHCGCRPRVGRRC
jgi:hypothetical protein